MRKLLLYLFLFSLVLKGSGQSRSLIKAGEKAPPFVLNRGENTIQGFTMPYLNKIVLLHFWNTSTATSRSQNHFLKQIFDKYSESDFINAEGFEIIAIAVQSDQNTWNQTLQNDSLSNFIHGIALKGFSAEDVCQKFGVTQVPTNILIDEKGEVAIVNPRFSDLENYLDNKKNVHPQKKDVFGMMALSSSLEDKVRFSKIYLFNRYGDTLAYTRTNENGVFSFHELTLNREVVLKIDNQIDILTTDPTALYNTKGELLAKGKTQEGGFVFELSTKLLSKMQVADSNLNTVSPLEITVTKHLEFKNNTADISPKDEKELSGILSTMLKNQKSVLEIAVHTNNTLDEKSSKALSDRQAQALKTYFLKQGVAQNRIRLLSFGSSQPLIQCSPSCTEEENKKNKRVEFTVLKN